VRTGVTASSARAGAHRWQKPYSRGVLQPQRQWRDDGHTLDRGVGLPRRSGDDHRHAQRRHVRDAVIAWRIKQGKPDPSGYWWSLPVVAETWDGDLSDANGFHVKAEHVFAALDSARGGALAEGNVGGGTAMICHELKCGTGTSSRVVEIAGQRYTVGVLVQANYGVRSELRIAGVPVGKFMPIARESQDHGSIIIVVATDAPLLPQQLKRLARRAALGLARNGSYAGDGRAICSSRSRRRTPLRIRSRASTCTRSPMASSIRCSSPPCRAWRRAS
jgi:hypothetical protein